MCVADFLWPFPPQKKTQEKQSHFCFHLFCLVSFFQTNMNMAITSAHPTMLPKSVSR